MSQRTPAASPCWRPADFVRLIAGLGAGGVVCALAWAGAANRVRLDDQWSWVSLGVVGLAVAVGAEAMWLRRGRRAVGHYRSRLVGDVSRMAEHRKGDSSISSSGELVAAAGLQRYHRAGCPLAIGPRWIPASQRAHETAGRTPCGICRP